MVFGVLTVFSGGRALFGPAEVKVAMGQVILWVLWFNFSAGFLYVAVGWGLWQSAFPWAAHGSLLLASATAIVAAALALHITQGGAFEKRTVGAMLLRLVFWVSVAALAYRKNSAAPR